MLADCGFETGMAKELLEPLVRGNIDKLLASSPEEALTGPVERGDVETVQKHLKELTPKEREVYTLLGRTLVQIAARKNPEQDYRTVQKILED